MQLQSYLDDLIAEYRATWPDRKFKLVPNGPDTTMRKILTGARDTLQACAQANIGGTASQSFVDRINNELDK